MMPTGNWRDDEEVNQAVIGALDFLLGDESRAAVRATMSQEVFQREFLTQMATFGVNIEDPEVIRAIPRVFMYVAALTMKAALGMSPGDISRGDMHRKMGAAMLSTMETARHVMMNLNGGMG